MQWTSKDLTFEIANYTRIFGSISKVSVILYTQIILYILNLQS